MENKIVRECVQGLIDDSKMIDRLCESLETERINLEKVITDLASKPVNIDIQNARSSADEAKYEAGYADDSCMEGEQYISDAEDIFKDLQSALEKASSIEDATQNEETTTTN